MYMHTSISNISPLLVFTNTLQVVRSIKTFALENRQPAHLELGCKFLNWISHLPVLPHEKTLELGNCSVCELVSVYSMLILPKLPFK